MILESKNLFLIVTTLCHFILAEEPSVYDNPNYNNENTDYNNNENSEYNNYENTDYNYNENTDYNNYENNNYNNYGVDNGYDNAIDDGIDNQEEYVDYQTQLSYKNTQNADGTKDDDCWMSLKASDHFKSMDELDNAYLNARETYQNQAGIEMDNMMMDALLNSRGAAPRAIHNFEGDAFSIPAGINLGGYCMLRLNDSILIFHRMKLRNSTNFRVNYLHNDLMNMTMTVNLNLNDLHLVGTYERSATQENPSILYYKPSFGTLELLLKDVNYRIEARMRMMSDRLTIELITSNLVIRGGALLSYLNTNMTNIPDYTERVQPRNIDDYLQRMKTDLDLWLKDYFNDFLMYFDLPPYDSTQLQEYEKKKTIMLNEYVNFAVNTIRQKVFNLGGFSLALPGFSLYSLPMTLLTIKDGTLRGLDTMYRRSMATGKREGNVRLVDVIVGFSKMRAEYNFEAALPNGSPSLHGLLVLAADELTARLSITLVTNPDSVDLNVDFIQQMRPESLTVEGPANRLIANFKHQLEHQIIALMSNSLLHYVKMLSTITRCTPLIYPREDQDPYIPGDDSEEILRSGKTGNKIKVSAVKRIKTGKKSVPQKLVAKNNKMKRVYQKELAKKINKNITLF